MGWLDRLFPKTTPIGRVLAGRTVTVRGWVVPRDLIVSPLDGVKCVHYHFRAEVWRSPSVMMASLGAAGGTWNVVHDDEAIAEFYLRDDTGTVIVAPERAVVTHPSFVPREITMEERQSEALIVPDDRVEVTGDAEEVDDLHDGERAYREFPRRLILRAKPDGVLRIRKL